MSEQDRYRERDGAADAQARLDEMETRLGDLFDAVSEGFHDISGHLSALADLANGPIKVERRVSVGGLLDMVGSLKSTELPVPEHSLRQTVEAWNLEVNLPSTTLPEIRIESLPGRLTVTTPRQRLSLAIPEDLAVDALDMRFQAGVLYLHAPRRGDST